MGADLTREQAREQVARELAREFGGFLAHDPHNPQRFWNSTAAPILDVLWPVVEKYQRGAKTLGEILDRTLLDIVAATDSQDLINEDGDGDWALVHERLAGMGAMVRRAEGLEVEVERLRAELAHAHTVIARHVEPLRKPCRPEAGDCCDGSAHTWQPSQSSMLPGRVDGNTPSDALYGDLTGERCGPGVSGRVDETGGSE